jgi:hypothetical protein
VYDLSEENWNKTRRVVEIYMIFAAERKISNVVEIRMFFAAERKFF